MPGTPPNNVVSIAHLRGVVDETGQAVTIRAPRRRKRRKGWRDSVSLVDIGLMNRLELSGLETRVLFAVMSFVPEKGGADAFCTQREVAEKMGVPQQSVARAMNVLQERRLIAKIRNGRWHVNTWLMYNGDFDSWNAEAEQDPEPIWMKGVDGETGEVR